MISEKLIIVDDIELIDLYGINNLYYNKIISYFPKLKITGRGNELKINGNKLDIDLFEKKLKELTLYFQNHGAINIAIIDQIYQNELSINENSNESYKDTLVYGNNGKLVRARTPNQQKLVDLYDSNDLLFAIGPAGSGKTYTSIALSVRALRNKEVRRIILTRPAVEAGERLGFLPGDVKEKLDPYLQPLYDALNDMIPHKKLINYIEEGVVQIAPLAFMRGRTLDHAFVILDEAQNTTLGQLKMFLTRMGANAKFIVTGDLTQIDLPRKSDSGLLHAINILQEVKGIGFINFDERDIIRHPLVKQIVRAFDSDK